MKLQVSPLLLAAALAGYLLQVSVPALAQQDVDRPVGQGADGTAVRAPIPPGVPTTPDNVYLPTESEMK